MDKALALAFRDLATDPLNPELLSRCHALEQRLAVPKNQQLAWSLLRKLQNPNPKVWRPAFESLKALGAVIKAQLEQAVEDRHQCHEKIRLLQARIETTDEAFLKHLIAALKPGPLLADAAALLSQRPQLAVDFLERRLFLGFPPGQGLRARVRESLVLFRCVEALGPRAAPLAPALLGHLETGTRESQVALVRALNAVYEPWPEASLRLLGWWHPAQPCFQNIFQALLSFRSLAWEACEEMAERLRAPWPIHEKSQVLRVLTQACQGSEKKTEWLHRQVDEMGWSQANELFDHLFWIACQRPQVRRRGSAAWTLLQWPLWAQIYRLRDQPQTDTCMQAHWLEFLERMQDLAPFRSAWVSAGDVS